MRAVAQRLQLGDLVQSHDGAVVHAKKFQWIQALGQANQRVAQQRASNVRSEQHGVVGIGLEPSHLGMQPGDAAKRCATPS